MRHVLTIILLSTLVVAGCAPKAEKATLREGTPAYALAKDLAAIMPALGPDKTTVIAEAKGIAVTAAEVLQTMRDNMGNRVDQLKTLDAGRLKEIFERGATQIVARKLSCASVDGKIPVSRFYVYSIQSSFGCRGLISASPAVSPSALKTLFSPSTISACACIVLIA